MTPKKQSTKIVVATREKIDRILALEKITVKDIEDLDQAERQYLIEVVTQTLKSLTDVEHDAFFAKVEMILSPGTKNSVWEQNHLTITKAIAAYMSSTGIMPPRYQIAEATGLSRQTVAKHFKEYALHPQFAAEAEQFKFMANKVLSTVFQSANNGDTRAARLFLEAVGAINKHQPNPVINQQHNYIQVNNTILSQENLKQLTAEELNQIESVIMNNVFRKNLQPGEIINNSIRI